MNLIHSRAVQWSKVPNFTGSNISTAGIKNSIFQRMKHFDDENIAGYIEVRLI